MTYRQERERFIGEAQKRYGIGPADARRLLRHGQTLNAWAVHECNGTRERDETTGKTFGVCNINGPGPIKRYPIRDTETPARKGIERIAKAYNLRAIFQGDPRGYVAHVCRPEDVKDEYNYNGLGIPARD